MVFARLRLAARNLQLGARPLRGLAAVGVLRARESAELREQMCRAMRGLAEIGEVEALVLPVGIAGRVFEPQEQRRNAAEHLDERTHERDRTAAAHLHRIAPVARAQCTARGVERGTLRASCPGATRTPIRARASAIS